MPKVWEQLESDAVMLKSKGLVKYGFVWQGASYEALTCDFVEYLGSAGGTVLNSEIPTVQSVRSSAAVVKANPVLATVPHTRLIPQSAQTPQCSKMSQAIIHNVNSVLAGSASASSALSGASDSINSAVSNSGRNRALEGA